ncbi:hypothetical protein ACFC0K_15975 [Streptomyces hydrogenans]|uniref:hypothetical protein n=1 Tax=Streptomyces hydrogenans TaxID=1873719 RepID=UPI0035D9EC36
MPDSEPPTPPYSVSEELVRRAAIHDASAAVYEAAQRLARSTLVVIAAAIQDILTNHSEDPQAPFDARYLELMEAVDGSLWATGRYWTASDSDEALDLQTTPGVEDAEMGLYGLNEWVPALDESNRDTWNPLVAIEKSHALRHYRLDLVRAAKALPLD